MDYVFNYPSILRFFCSILQDYLCIIICDFNWADSVYDTSLQIPIPCLRQEWVFFTSFEWNTDLAL
jgi:hypothetical protein